MISFNWYWFCCPGILVRFKRWLSYAMGSCHKCKSSSSLSLLPSASLMYLVLWQEIFLLRLIKDIPLLNNWPKKDSCASPSVNCSSDEDSCFLLWLHVIRYFVFRCQLSTLGWLLMALIMYSGFAGSLILGFKFDANLAFFAIWVVEPLRATTNLEAFCIRLFSAAALIIIVCLGDDLPWLLSSANCS